MYMYMHETMGMLVYSMYTHTCIFMPHMSCSLEATGIVLGGSGAFLSRERAAQSFTPAKGRSDLLFTMPFLKAGVPNPKLLFFGSISVAVATTKELL